MMSVLSNLASRVLRLRRAKSCVVHAVCTSCCSWTAGSSCQRKIWILLVFTLSVGLVFLGLNTSSPISHQLLWRPVPRESRLPQAIIVGARKCGTRALLGFLSMHPDVITTQPEMHFFNRDDRYSQGLDWYRRQMAPSLAGQITMEKTPGYFISSEAPARIRQMNDSIKLLLIVRDPVTRMLSDFAQLAAHRQNDNETSPTFEESVIDSRTNKINLKYWPLYISLYYLHWLPWQAQFSESQLHIVDGERLLVDPVHELRKVEQFLGIKAHLKAEHFFRNETSGLFCRNRDPSSAAARCYDPAHKGRPHPDVRPDVIHKLYDFFKVYNGYFFKNTGRYFDWTEEAMRRRTGRI